MTFSTFPVEKQAQSKSVIVVCSKNSSRIPKGWEIGIIEKSDWSYQMVSEFSKNIFRNSSVGYFFLQELLKDSISFSPVVRQLQWNSDKNSDQKKQSTAIIVCIIDCINAV